MSMTVAQAKSELMQIYGMLSPDKQRAIDTVVKMEPCEDAINRQAVLDGIEELKKSSWATDKRGNGFEYLITEALDVVADLCVKQEPFVNPQPKIGHWVYDNYNWRCSECNETPKTMGYVGTADFMSEHFKFCNHCGAKMESEE